MPRLVVLVPRRPDHSQGTAGAERIACTSQGRRIISPTDSAQPRRVLTVADVGEFAVIDRAVGGRTQPPTTILGPGDDAALVRTSDGRVVVSTDMLLEGRHFRFDWSSPREVGRKAVAQNAADIASMGGRPTAFLVSLGCPPDTPVAVADGISAGIWDGAAELGAGVVGGDLVQAPQVVISVTVLGDLAGAAPVRRSGAQAGDIVAIAGRVGRSAAGLGLLVAGSAEFPELVDAHRVPIPPYAQAWAAAGARVNSMTDISDGLIADLGHLCAASGVGVAIERGAVPLEPSVVAAAELLGVDHWMWVLTGGEDHAFAATFPSDATLPEGWDPIGEVQHGGGVTVDGVPWPGAGGWESFSV